MVPGAGIEHAQESEPEGFFLKNRDRQIIRFNNSNTRCLKKYGIENQQNG